MKKITTKIVKTIKKWPSSSLLAIHLIPTNWVSSPPSTLTAVDAFITNITGILLGAAGFVALVFIFWGGYLWITSTGDPGQIDKGKKTLLYAGAGLVLILLAGSIVNIVINFL